MKTSIRTELRSIILDRINDGSVNDNNIQDLHFICFNEDYFIIGYYQASQWLEQHDLDAFEAIEIVREYEVDHLGEFTTKINSESIVNMLAYIYGEQIISDIDFDTVEELENKLS